MISDKHKFIFVHINKTGGTSIEKVFEPTADQKDVADGDVRYKHFTLSEYRTHYPRQYSEYFKFVFVRNPWDWLVSRYHWSKNVQKLFNYSFSEFLNRLATKTPLSTTADWLEDALATQWSRMAVDNVIAVNFIGKFEPLQIDFDRVCHEMKLQRRVLPVTFKTVHAHYSTYYDSKTKAVVERLYAKDIDTFGYKFETP